MTKTFTASLFVVYSVCFLLLGLNYPMLNEDGRFDAGFFPRVTAVALVVLSVWNLVRERRRTVAAELLRNVAEAGLILALMVVYIVLMYLWGTTIPTFLFTLLVLVWFNRGKMVVNVLMSAALAASVYVVFVVWFKAALPEGLFTVAGLP